MNNQLEDRVRELLADRTAGVVPPTGWEDRVLSAGRRRRTRRRVGSAAAAVAAVVVVLVAASAIGLPRTLTGIVPVNGPDGSGPINVRDMPVGERTSFLHTTSPPSVGAGNTVWFGDTSEPADVGPYGAQLAGDGIVADRSIGNSFRSELLYIGPDGSEQILRTGPESYSFEVSPDGTRVAWFELGTNGDNERLTVAELPSGRVVETRKIAPGDLPGRGWPDVVAYVDGQVMLDTDQASQPLFAWDPETGEIAPWRSGAPLGGTLVGLSVEADTLLVRREGCVLSKPLSDPTAPARWKICVDYKSMRISPDGTKLAGYGVGGPDIAAVYDLDTGELIWDQQFTRSFDLWETIREQRMTRDAHLQQVEWESPNSVLYTFSAADVTSGGYELMRCAADQPRCERVPTGNGDPVTGLGTN